MQTHVLGRKFLHNLYDKYIEKVNDNLRVGNQAKEYIFHNFPHKILVYNDIYINQQIHTYTHKNHN